MVDETHTGRLEIQRRYPHPVDRVFQAWTDAEHVKPWWGPADFTATQFENDFREGGAWRAVIVGPDGHSYGQSGRYTRIEANRLIAFTFRWDEDDAPDTEITVGFAPEGDRTLVTFRQSPFRDDESRTSHEAGWRECLDRLGARLGEGRR
ncbi:SRPBCC family protein [Celeribacter indicus]|uniref:Activator of Hsp90 ATPase 1 family protein n=1 Tax=Celeribacter indicus TaxID=1208324 RepID=A0A0B5E2N2_9RHOB|nr:SRPBCC domain-containing protein [Celeribacter indicus]AJE46697.1 activator of Hsp90 ATPase 1 family protein [Celeribacter indicus]SDX04224.1 Uncharacterized conserved protein YndB, AHSA1/START domain [Celeribacter indicus]